MSNQQKQVPRSGNEEQPDVPGVGSMCAEWLAAQMAQSPDSKSDKGGQPSSPKPRIYALPPEYAKQADEARQNLARSCPQPSGSEQILYRLASQEAGLAALIQEIELQLALRVLLTMDSPRQAAAVARVLKSVSAIGATVGKRICATLTTAAVLRSQHRLIEIGPDES